jgi:hypothetical protein
MIATIASVRMSTCGNYADLAVVEGPPFLAILAILAILAM